MTTYLRRRDDLAADAIRRQERRKLALVALLCAALVVLASYGPGVLG